MPHWNTVVVGYDGSDYARDAVMTAAEIVSDGGTIHVVTAYRTPSAYPRFWDELPEEFRESYDSLSVPHGYQAEALHLLGQRGVTAEGHLVEDDPAGAILDVVDNVGADLVIVGSRGLGRAARFLRGSVSSRVANEANSSVLVIHDAELSAERA